MKVDLRLLPISILLVPLAGCSRHPINKPDETKGSVSGIVICADTGKPARFAKVSLTSAVNGKSQKGDEPLPSDVGIMTGIDGRFRIEAVRPGRYYAYATLPGYVNPEKGIDLAHIMSVNHDEITQRAAAIKAWKAHLVEVDAVAGRNDEITITIDRAAEISGTVTYDDGSPAIGVHFQLLRKTEKNGFSTVGFRFFNNWSIATESDSHGHYLLTDLPAGEFTVCAMLPADNEDAAPHFCLGDVYRIKDAKTFKLSEGEVVPGVDIVIPLGGLHSISGHLEALADGHAINNATVRLLNADDHSVAVGTTTDEDGDFWFDEVPEGSYILEVSNATGQITAQPAAQSAQDNQANSSTACAYADKDLPVNLKDDVNGLVIKLGPCVTRQAVPGAAN